MRNLQFSPDHPEYLLAKQLRVLADYDNKDYDDCIAHHSKCIDAIWAAEQAQRGEVLFNGKILNLAATQWKQETLILHCHPIEYKHYIAQRTGVPLGITPLAVSGLVFFEHGGVRYGVIGKRAETVMQYPGCYECIPSGSIDANALLVPGQPIAYEKQLLIELEEELGVAADQVKSCHGFCLILDQQDQVYDIGLAVEIEPPVHLQAQNAEYSRIEAVPMSEIALYKKQEKWVDTSRTLFKAWDEQTKGAGML